VFGCVRVIDDFLVNLLDVVLPSSADICWVAVAGRVEDQETDVVILPWIGIDVE
jgi:hypothetical protein